MPMSGLFEMLKELDIPEDKLQEIAAAAKENPMAAMGAIQEYFTPEMIQKFMAFSMSNPDALGDLASQAGISEEKLQEAKNQFPGL